MKILTNYNFNQNQIQNVVAHVLASAPSSPASGQFYYNSGTNTLEYYNGTGWVNPLARSSHTGTQLSSTISDLAATVQAYKLNQFATPNGNIAMGGYTLTGLPTPTGSGQPAEYDWVVSQVQASAAGIDNKPSVIAVATSNVATRSGTAQTVDGVALDTVGMRVLLTGQTTASQNGPWVVQAGSWIRPTGETVTSAAFWMVEQGTSYSGSQWKVGTTGTIVLDTTSLTITRWGVTNTYTNGNGLDLTGFSFSIKLNASYSGLVVDASGLAVDTSSVVRKYAATIGDGSSTSITVTHNLGTQDVTVSVRDASTHAFVECDVTANASNTIVLGFAVAPATNALRVTVHG